MLISVNYHYIDSEDRYERGIYPTSPERLRDQLLKLGRRYTFVHQSRLLDAIAGRAPLPEQSCLITFDDGLKSQFSRAVPVLRDMGIPAVFFINSLPHTRKKACQVHKIHHLLSLCEPRDLLAQVAELHQRLLGSAIDEKPVTEKLAQTENRYDAGATAQLKYILNSRLAPADARVLVDALFSRYCADEQRFCADLYLSPEDIRSLDRDPLFSIGLHTESHVNIPYETKDAVEADIRNNHRYLTRELCLTSVKAISYPIGKVSEQDIRDKIASVAHELDLAYGLTMGRAENERLEAPLFLSRYDTNDVVGGKRPII